MGVAKASFLARSLKVIPQWEGGPSKSATLTSVHASLSGSHHSNLAKLAL